MSNNLFDIIFFMLVEFADRHAQAYVEGRNGAYRFKRSEQKRFGKFTSIAAVGAE